MRSFIDTLFRLVLLVAGLGLLFGPGAAVAQTGPGGVGDATGATAGESLTMWLRSDEGVTKATGGDSQSGDTEVELWKDQSGEGHDLDEVSDNIKRQPIYEPNALNGKPVIKFNTTNQDNTDALKNTQSAVKNIPTGSNTFFVLSVARQVPSDNFWQTIHFNQQENIGYNTSGEVVADQSGPTLKTSTPTLTEYNVFSSVFDGSDAEEDLAVNGTVRASATGVSSKSKAFFEIGKNGTTAKENVVEVIAYESALNTAERRLVANYLAEKHSLTMASNDYYRFGSGHPNDIVGIGRATADAGASNGGPHTEATSSRLTIQEDGSNALNDGEFVMVGHDGKAAGSFTTNERPNGNANVQKIEREWRAEVTGTGSKKVDVEVDYSSLSLPGSYNDRALFVDSDGDFTSGATYYDLDNKSGSVYEASGVDISDGDYVTVAAVKRVVNFKTTTKNKRENTGDSPNMEVKVKLNFPHDSDITVNFADTGDLDDSNSIEDGGATNQSGTNGNGDYEADGGSGSDTGGSEGSFDGDYRLNSSSVTINSGNTTGSLGIELDDDNITSPPEQSEKFEATISSVGAGAATGTDSRFVGTIIDDDNPNKIAYSASTDNDGRDKEDASYNKTTQNPEKATTLVYEVAVPDGNTGNSSPATEATYEVTGGSATPGTDFKLVDGRNGTRVDKTEGTVTIPSGNQYGRFEIDVLEDQIFEGDETVTLELTEAQGGTIDGDDKTSLTLTIKDDDSKPTVQFDSDLFTSREDTDADLSVSLSAKAGTDVTVTFEDEGTGSASAGGTDYTFPSTPTITIPAGNTSGTFTIPVTNDETREDNEDIDVGIKSVTNATLGSRTSTTHTIVDDDGIGSQGPGGVGDSESLAFWGKADGLGGTYDDGNDVNPWPDSSGNGNDAKRVKQSFYGKDLISDNSPTFVASATNGQPALSFDTERFYGITAPVMESLPDANYTLFGVSTYGSSGGKEALLDIQTSGANQDLLSFRYQNSGADVAIKAYSGSGAKTTNHSPSSDDLTKFHLLSAEVEGNELDLSYDGAERATNSFDWQGTGAAAILGHSLGDQRKLQGQMAEFIAYDTDLNPAQRNIVRNYLSAKYDLGLDTGNGAKDLYVGDKSSNGDYDFSVIGIGRDGGGSLAFLHSQAEGGGLTLSAETVQDGEYVLLGTTAEKPYDPVERMNYVGTDTDGSVSDLAARPDSIWFADVTGGTPSFDITFDLTALGFESRSRQEDGYVLLEAGTGCDPTSNNCTWSDAGGSVTVSGDEVTFQGVSLSSGGHYLSIGTTAPTKSPLLNEYARAVNGQAGTDGTDEGWRYVGVPVSGAVIDDLQPPLSTDRDGLVGFGQRDVWHWALGNGTGSNNDGWTQFGSGDQIPNGRGLIVKLDDDNEHSIDPTLWMDVEPNSGPPGDAGVTVGDDAPSADTKLRTDTTWHLLANPYTVDYDLSALNLDVNGDSDGDDDFKKGAQVWEPSNGSYATIMQAGDNSDHLAPWEAFFLERNDYDGGANTQLTFGKSGRQSTDSEDYSGSKSRSAPEGRQIDLRLIVRDGSGNELARDEAVGLYFHDEAGPGEDAYDLSKLMPAAQDFAALGVVADDRAGKRSLWAVYSRSRTPADTVTVPLDLQTDLSGSFSITAPNWTNVPDDWTVTLVDTKGTSTSSDDETHRLGRDGASPYVFSPGKSTRKNTTSTPTEGTSASDKAAPSVPPVRTLRPSRSTAAKTAGSTAKAAAPETRFRLRVAPGSEALPVEMASMNATVSEQSVRLAWTTASEQNNAGFYVEHQRLPSGDTTAAPKPGAWTEASFVDGAGTTQEPQDYSTQLRDLDYGRHVFRLRQVDTDGTATYSDAVEADVRLEEGHAVGTPYPNPTRQQATLEVTVREEQPVRVQLYDLLGRRVRTVYDDTVPAQETRRLRMSTDQLASGAYFLRVQGDDFVETRRVTVVR